LAIFSCTGSNICFNFFTHWIEAGLSKNEVQTSWEIIIGVIAKCLLFPAITEEVFFRVLLLPHPTENALTVTLWFWGGISLVAFIVYHPLNALNLLSRWTQNFF
jgi:predicted Abi (CAAX) family protease